MQKVQSQKSKGKYQKYIKHKKGVKKIIEVPSQLKNKDFRFFLVRANDKKPAQKSWTTKNNYTYDQVEKWYGNYGVLCGKGNLVVLDFDDMDYFMKVRDKLPVTFTVLSAGRQLPHLYYIITDMPNRMKKIGIDDEQGNRVCDVQASRTGVVGPNSKINGKEYKVIMDLPIKQIKLQQIKQALGIKENDIKQRREYKGEPVFNNIKVASAYAALYMAGVEINYDINMKCPFHDMNGNGNLSVTPSGKIYCFHCLRDMYCDEFLAEYLHIPYYTAKKIRDLIENLYKDKQNK